MSTVSTKQELNTGALVFFDDDLARVVAQGGRYGGDWAVRLTACDRDWRPLGDPLGEVRVLGGTPGRACDLVGDWLRGQCERAGNLRLAHAEDINHLRPVVERPFFMAGRFLIDRRPA